MQIENGMKAFAARKLLRLSPLEQLPLLPINVQGQTHPLLEQKDSGDKLRSLSSSETLKCFTLVSKLEADLDHHALPTRHLLLLQRILFSFS